MRENRGSGRLRVVRGRGAATPRQQPRRHPSSALPCYNASPASPQWREVAAAVPQLVRWYEDRLHRFDEAISRRGAGFAGRVERLRQARARAAKAESKVG